jgi:asparagine synthase (glutamine-hydrolysing)
MCGIVGIWNTDGSPLGEPDLNRFTDSLVHRGPDGKGIYIDSKACLGLGHRRLAILDLTETGHQPMSYADKRYWIVYNGEIYNFLELRDELEGLGHTFQSDSDTEVILSAYVQWGEGCQFKFNGMWAFAIWDSKERILFLSRDRFGVKPLHYMYDGRCFSFSSEMKAFLNLSWFHPRFNPDIVASALANITAVEGTIDCLLQGVKRLKGGYSLTLRQGQKPKIRRWWNTLEHLVSAPADFQKQTEKFRDLFFDACKIRMRSDVPIGTALSGGLDSGSVLCSMADIRSRSNNGQRLAADWQKAFVATFSGTSQDERVFAEQVASHSQAVPIFKEIDPSQIIDSLDQVIFQFEEIFDIPSAAWLIYRKMRRNGVIVSIDGHGGDELLAGYHHHTEFAMRVSLIPKPKPMRFFELRSILRHMYPEGIKPNVPNVGYILKQWLLENKESYPTKYKLARFINQAVKKIRPNQKTQTHDKQWLRIDPRPAYYADYESDKHLLCSLDPLTSHLYYDFHFSTLPTILRNFDRCSMAHGVEVRAPFMDWRLVCYAFSLPAESKLGGGYTKRILREAMRGILPETIRTRTSKVGFSSPLVDWFSGPLRIFVLDSVNSKAFLQSEIWNGPAIRDFVEESFSRGNYSSARRSWEFIQAMKLMELYKANIMIENG